MMLTATAAVTPGLEEGFTHREHTDHEDDDIDPIEQLRDTERQACVAGPLIDADQSQRQAQEQAEEPSDD